MSIAVYSNWLGTWRGGFPPWDRFRRADRRTDITQSAQTRKSSKTPLYIGLSAAFSAASHCIIDRIRIFGNLWRIFTIQLYKTFILCKLPRGTNRTSRTAANSRPPSIKQLSNRLIVLDLPLLHVLYYIYLYHYLLLYIYAAVLLYYGVPLK